MPATVLFESGSHKNILLPDFGEGVAVQANQHLVVDGSDAAILDPGGHKIYSKVLGETSSQLGRAKLRYLLLSHQDPDIVAAVNGWLMTTDATAYAPSLWVRFIPHFGLDRLVQERLKGVADAGCTLPLGGSELRILPAHFLHSPGNFQVYDPVSKILYTGDLGASIGQDYVEVTDFDLHLKYMEGFHRRYMASNRALKAWARVARSLDVETIAPQHGALFRGKALVEKFIAWCEGFECGVDFIDDLYRT